MYFVLLLEASVILSEGVHKRICYYGFQTILSKKILFRVHSIQVDKVESRLCYTLVIARQLLISRPSIS
jgi:hypothetical protein